MYVQCVCRNFKGTGVVREARQIRVEHISGAERTGLRLKAYILDGSSSIARRDNTCKFTVVDDGEECVHSLYIYTHIHKVSDNMYVSRWVHTYATA